LRCLSRGSDASRAVPIGLNLQVRIDHARTHL
jgi:hypothetical protein